MKKLARLTKFKDFGLGDTVKIKIGAYGDYWDGRIGKILEIVILPDFDNSERIYVLVEFESSVYHPFSSIPHGLDEKRMLCYWRSLTKDLDEVVLVKREQVAPSNEILSVIEKARCYARLGKPQEPIEGF